MSEPKVLFIDIETAPCLGWTWGMYEQNVIDLKKSWYILCFAYKWQDEKKIHAKALTDYRKLRDSEDDSSLVSDIWHLCDRADVIVAHNGDKFDKKKIYARFAKHGLNPPSPAHWFDTLKLARSQFGFLSNRLNDLCAYLGIGRKMPHTGFDLWKRCMLLERKAMKIMKRYNARDVWLLVRLYDRLKPFSKTHPNLSLFKDRPGCPVCTSHKVHRRGWNIAKTRKTPRLQCSACGHWFSGKAE